MNKLKLKQMLESFLIEDIGERDLSAEAIFDETQQGTATFIAKEDGIVSGLFIIEETYKLLHSDVSVKYFTNDGEAIRKGEAIAAVTGPIRVLLSGERVALNLVQRMSGIATLTAKCVAETSGTKARICDTRKTTPGLRMLEKYAVRTGGGVNHRNGLYDAIMIKDNHISFAGSITKAVEKAKAAVGHTVKVEVEIETVAQLQEAVAAGADIIMFDNRTPDEIRDWLSYVPSYIITEASGGITDATIRAYAESGVHYISLGALTHSVRALDISLLHELKA